MKWILVLCVFAIFGCGATGTAYIEGSPFGDPNKVKCGVKLEFNPRR